MSDLCKDAGCSIVELEIRPEQSYVSISCKLLMRIWVFVSLAVCFCLIVGCSQVEASFPCSERYSS